MNLRDVQHPWGGPLALGSVGDDDPAAIVELRTIRGMRREMSEAEEKANAIVTQLGDHGDTLGDADRSSQRGSSTRPEGMRH